MPFFTKETPRAQHPQPTAAPRPPARPAVQGALLWQAGAGAAGCLLAAGQVYGGAAPFGLALALGCPDTWLLPAVAGAVAGSFAFQPLTLALKLTGAIVAAMAGRLACKQAETRSYIGGLAGAGGALLAEQLAVLIAGRAPVADTAAVVLTALGAAAISAGIRKLPHNKIGRASWTERT